MKIRNTDLDPVGSVYRMAFFFSATPTPSEKLMIHSVTDAFQLPANMTGSRASTGTNPASSFVMNVQKNGSTIGTITIATNGAVTFATTGGTAQSFAVNDVVRVVAPSSADGVVADVSVTLRGTLT